MRQVWFALTAACLIACSIGATPRHGTVPRPIQRAVDGAPKAELGVYYFDGWSGSLANGHFEGLLHGAYQDRQPLSGWLATRSSLRSDLYWASKMGVSFFDFLYYYGAKNVSDDPHLNDALENYRSLARHDGVGFAITYINVDPFVVPLRKWHRMAELWVTKYFLDPDYARIDGEPVFAIHDSVRFFEQHDGDPSAPAQGDASVNAALEELRAVAREHGLPGVFVIGGVYVDHVFDWRYFPEPTLGESYDALNQYAYPGIAGTAPGERDFAEIAVAEEHAWNLFGIESAHPYVPTIMAGWDPRPWNETVDGQLFWFRRSPPQIAQMIDDAVSWVAQYPSMSVEPAPTHPLVFLTAWNEFGEGQFIDPTVGDRYSYGTAIAAALGLSWDPQPRVAALTIVGRGSVMIGGERCEEACSVPLDEGLVAKLHAHPEHGWGLERWTGGCTGAGPRCSILMDADVSVVATFVRRRSGAVN